MFFFRSLLYASIRSCSKRSASRTRISAGTCLAEHIWELALTLGSESFRLTHQILLPSRTSRSPSGSDQSSLPRPARLSPLLNFTFPFSFYWAHLTTLWPRLPRSPGRPVTARPPVLLEQIPWTPSTQRPAASASELSRDSRASNLSPPSGPRNQKSV